MMACLANRAPFLRMVTRRGFSAMASSRPVGEVAAIETAVLDNKVFVATAESTIPISRVSIVFRAGSRYESYDLQGASYIMRVTPSMSTEGCSGFITNRNIQQIGGNLFATSDRETITFTVETTGNHIETGLRYLQELIHPAFKPWELADVTPVIKTQISVVSPRERAVELLHKAAFRHGLGNSIYIPKHQIGKLSPESLMHYFCSTCTASRAAVVGVGIDFNALCGFAYNLDFANGSKKNESNPYHGGDVRKDTGGDWAHVALAGHGGGVNENEALAYAVLASALGAGAGTKRGNSNGSFGKALTASLPGTPFQLNVINASYLDTGLFGFVLSCSADKIGKGVETLAKLLKCGALSSEDIKRGKRLLKISVLEKYSNDKLLHNEIAQQAILFNEVQPAKNVLACIDKVTEKEVQEIAKKVGASPLSIGAVGNLRYVPYSTDLS